jgi:hypothetical protein
VADAEFIGWQLDGKIKLSVKHEIPDVAVNEDTVFHCCSRRPRCSAGPPPG